MLSTGQMPEAIQCFCTEWLLASNIITSTLKHKNSMNLPTSNNICSCQLFLIIICFAVPCNPYIDKHPKIFTNVTQTVPLIA